MPTYEETLAARVHAVRTQIPPMQQVYEIYLRDRDRPPPVGPNSRSRQDIRAWDRGCATTASPIFQRLTRSVASLREHTSQARGESAQARQRRALPDYAEAARLLREADAALSRWRRTPAFPFDMVNMGPVDRLIMRVARKLSDLPETMGRGAGEYTRALVREVTGRETPELLPAITGREPTELTTRRRETNWTTLLLAIGVVSVVILGGGLLLGMSRRRGVREKLSRHAYSLKERLSRIRQRVKAKKVAA